MTTTMKRPRTSRSWADVKENTELEEDIKDIDQQDRYEHLYNTRFEQDNLVSYPRWVR